MNKLHNIPAIFLALIMIIFGLNKFFNFIPMPEPDAHQMKIFQALMTLGWIMPLVATAEIVAGILLTFNKTRPLGAIIILPVVVGIVLHHLAHDASSMALPIVLLIINAWVIYSNRAKFLTLVA